VSRAFGLALTWAALAGLAPPASSAQPDPLGQEQPPALGQDNAEALFHEGNRLYQAEDYSGALSAYLAVQVAGLSSPALDYNIGNAHFRLGKLGSAILHYERARRAAPGDENIRANLVLARSLTADDIIPLPEFWVVQAVRWVVNLAPRPLLIGGALGGYAAACVLFAVVLLARRSGRWVRPLAATALAAAALTGANLAVRELGMAQTERAVLLAESVPVQSAPSDDPALRLFTIHEGAVVRIDRRADGWLEIVLEDGQVGWIPADTAETI